MNILSLRCDNLFMFMDFSIDFTYKKQRKIASLKSASRMHYFPILKFL